MFLVTDGVTVSCLVLGVAPGGVPGPGPQRVHRVRVRAVPLPAARLRHLEAGDVLLILVGK